MWQGRGRDNVFLEAVETQVDESGVEVQGWAWRGCRQYTPRSAWENSSSTVMYSLKHTGTPVDRCRKCTPRKAQRRCSDRKTETDWERDNKMKWWKYLKSCYEASMLLMEARRAWVEIVRGANSTFFAILASAGRTNPAISESRLDLQEGYTK